MSFTYDGTPDTDLEKLRLRIGDTVSASALFSDEELQVFLTAEGSVELAAATACEALATRFAAIIDFQTDDQRFDNSKRVANYLAMAKTMRSTSSGVTGVVPTKQDGYSQDVAADDFSQGGRTGRSNYFTNRDRVY